MPPQDSLSDPKVKAVLDDLHARAGSQKLELLGTLGSTVMDALLRRKRSVAEQSHLAKDLYIPLSRAQGVFAYSIARAIGAKRIVEFGTSFGISTLYFAAAVRDNGGGIVIGSELEPAKVAAARANIERAGLSDQVEIREGDARETLKDPGGTVDMVLLDGWKDLYIPIAELLEPHLRTGSVVLADNIYLFRSALKPYVERMQAPGSGFRSVTLFLSDGMEYSVRL